MLLTVEREDTPKSKLDEIEKIISNNPDELIQSCREYLGLVGDKHYCWMLAPYRNRRSSLFNIIEYLDIHSSSEDKSIERALKFIKHHRSSHKEWIEVNDLNKPTVELSLLSDTWFKLVTGFKKGSSIKKVHRHYYELAVFNVLMLDLSCGDAYVNNAFIYGDPNKQFIDWDTFYDEVDAYCKITELPINKNGFVNKLKNQLHNTAKSVDDHYPDNKYLVIDKGRPILKKTKDKEEPPDLDKIREAIMAEMPIISIVDAMVDVEK